MIQEDLGGQQEIFTVKVIRPKNGRFFEHSFPLSYFSWPSDNSVQKTSFTKQSMVICHGNRFRKHL